MRLPLRGSSLRSSKTFLSLPEDAVIALCSLGLRSGRLRGAVSTTRDHCGCASKDYREISLDPVGHHIAVTDPAYDFALGDCACPSFPAHTPSLVCGGNVIICVVLTVLSAVPIPHSHSQSRTPRCGYADRRGLGSPPKVRPGTRELRLDCTGSLCAVKVLLALLRSTLTVLAPPSREARIDSRGASSMWQHGWHSQCDGGKFRNFCAVKAKRRLPSNAGRSLKLTQYGRDA